MQIPTPGTPEYEWWTAGATAEAKARRQGRSKAGLRVLSYVDALAEDRNDWDESDIAVNVFSVFGLAGQSLLSRAKLVLWVLRAGKGRARHRPSR